MSQPQPQAAPLPQFERPSEAVVYWTLLNLCEGAGGLFQVSLRRLARHCSLSASTTSRAVLSLAERNLIRYRPGANQVRPSTFELPTGRGVSVSPSGTAVPKIGVPIPNDYDPDLCRDIYLDDDEGSLVHKQDEHSDPDRARKLARTIAQTLDDTANLPLYISYCRRYPEQVILRALQEAREPAPEEIRVSRGALFNYLVQLYGGKSNHNPRPGAAAR